MERPPSGPAPPPQPNDSEPLAEAVSGLSQTAEDDSGPEMVSAETQTALLADAGVQCEPPGAGAEPAALAAQLADPLLAAFLGEAVPRCEAALQQNELVDPLRDELAALADEDAGEGPSAGATGSRSAAAGLSELHSFCDLLHSKGCTLSAVAWHPARRGVVAVACTQPDGGPVAQAGSAAPSTATPAAGARTGGTAPPAQHTPMGTGRQDNQKAAAAAAAAPAAAGTAGNGAADSLRQPPPGCILLWSHADAIHPELVLQPPAQALSFAFHPCAPHAWLAAGLSTGQVALFNLSQQQQQQQPALVATGTSAPGLAAVAGAGVAAASGTSAAAAEDAREEGSQAVLLLPAFVSSPDACHQAPVTDLQWLPGAAVTKDGRLVGAAAAAGAEGGAGGASAPAGSCAAGAAVAAGAEACNLFATTAADGSLLVWDMRVTTRQRKGAKDEEAPEWRPALALAAAQQPLMASRLCPDPRAGVGRFLVGSLEGELAVVEPTPVLHETKGGAEWALGTLQLAAGHTGRVLSLAFSPFFSDALLVVGDSGFVVWRVPAAGRDAAKSDGAEAGPSAVSPARCTPVFESPFCADASYTCGCWSPTKPGVVVLGRADGRLEAWDLLDRSHQAAMVAPVAPCALTALAASPAAPAGASGRSAGQQLLAVGDQAGTLRLLELPRMLRRRGHAEVRAMAALLAREQERLAEVARRAEGRAAEARAAAERARAEAATASLGASRRQQEAAAAATKAGVDPGSGEQDGEDVDERRYLTLEAEWRERLAGAGVSASAAAVPVGVA